MITDHLTPNAECQRVGCSRASIYGVRIHFARVDLHLDTTLGICERCRPFFIEHSTRDLVKQAVGFYAAHDIMVTELEALVDLFWISESSVPSHDDVIQ